MAGSLLQAPDDPTPNTVGVAPLAVEGDIAADAREALDARVDERIDAASVRRADLDAEGCADLECRRELAREAGANVLVQVYVSLDQRDYVIRSEIVAVDTGEVLRKDENYCEICTYDEALETLTQQIDNIREPLAAAMEAEAPGAPLTITSRPEQAVVRVDGDVVGSTPYAGEIKTGQHRLTLNREGYRESSQDLGVTTLDPIALDFRLRRNDQITVKAAVGWGLVIAAIPTLTSGVVLLAIDEKPHRASCTGASKDANGSCEFRYDTLGAGVGLTVGGLLAAGGGAALIVLDRKERGLLGGDKVEASAAVGPRGVVIRGRF